MKIAISQGNTKMGGIPSISLPPIATCRKDAPCRKDCYILKAWRMYAQTRAAYKRNLAIYQRNPDDFFSQLRDYLSKCNAPRFFRFHVSGDCPSFDYLQRVVKLATDCPDVKILVFTKRYEMVASLKARIPANLSIVLSAWPGLSFDNPKRLPVAYMNDGNEPRITGKALECPGNCQECGTFPLCWHLREIKRNVYFNKH